MSGERGLSSDAILRLQTACGAGRVLEIPRGGLLLLVLRPSHTVSRLSNTDMRRKRRERTEIAFWVFTVIVAVAITAMWMLPYTRSAIVLILRLGNFHNRTLVF
jgi:hypothetical protein